MNQLTEAAPLDVEGYQLHDPRFDCAHWFNSANEAIKMADKLGAVRFQAVTSDKKYFQISKIDGHWLRHDGSDVSTIPTVVDQSAPLTDVEAT